MTLGVQGFNGTSLFWRLPAIWRRSVVEVSGADVMKLAARAAKNDWIGECTHEGMIVSRRVSRSCSSSSQTLNA
jgi:hypothetical protein